MYLWRLHWGGGEGGPKICQFCRWTVLIGCVKCRWRGKGGGVKKSENIADVICTCPLSDLNDYVWNNNAGSSVLICYDNYHGCDKQVSQVWQVRNMWQAWQHCQYVFLNCESQQIINWICSAIKDRICPLLSICFLSILYRLSIIEHNECVNQSFFNINQTSTLY